MRGVADDIREQGAELVLVGSGSVEEARRFHEEQGLTTPLYTDPSLDTFRCAELRHGVVSSLSPRVFKHGFKALLEGHRQTTVQGSALQQGGTFVIARGGRVLYVHRSREAGDHPALAAILGALEGERATPRAGGAGFS